MQINPYVQSILITGDALNIKLSIPLLALINNEQVKPSRLPGRPRLLTEKDEKLAYALMKAGCSVAAVADAFEISRKSMYRYRDRFEQQL